MKKDESNESKKDSAPTPNVAFTAEQMMVIQQMLDDVKKDNRDSRRPDAVSMYNLRDPKSIESVWVKRIDGMYVMGYKNFQNDPFKKDKPKYYVLKKDEARGLNQEPFVTVRLQADENSEVIEKEMSLVDLVTEGKRNRVEAKVVEIKEKEVVLDHGILGSKGEYAGEVDDKNKPIVRATVLAQTKHTERIFYVKLEGFSKPVEFIADFLS